jgi:hypothetical protein
MMGNQQTHSNRKVWAILGGLITVLTLMVASAQLLNDRYSAGQADNASATAIAIQKHQVQILSEIATSAAQNPGIGPTATAIAERAGQLAGTLTALQNGDGQTGSPATPAKMDTPTSEPKYSGLISFASQSDSSILNPIFKWQAGGSAGSSYDLTIHPGTLAIAADGKTVQWGETNTAPIMLLPIRGNFDTSVGLVFNPQYHDQVAGLGVRSSENKNTYLRIIRFTGFPSGNGIVVQSVNDGEPSGGSYVNYKGNQVYLKIQRQGTIFNLSYSADGSSWDSLDKDFVFGLPSEVEIFLMVYSTDNHGIVGQFSNFEVSSK